MGAQKSSVETANDLMRAMTRLRARLRSETWSDEQPWSWSQLATLVRIVDHGPITTSDLAAAEHVRRQSMAETVSALRAERLVAVGPDPHDGRKLLIVATELGRGLRMAIPAARSAWLSAAIGADLDREEREVLRRAAAIMQRLADRAS